MTSESDEIDDLVWLLSKDAQPFGYSIELTRLIDGVSEYTYRDDEGSRVFPSHDEAYQHVRDKKNRLRREGVSQALAAAEARGRIAGMEQAARLCEDSEKVAAQWDGQEIRFACAAAIRAEAREADND